jgi:hypothetical protein
VCATIAAPVSRAIQTNTGLATGAIAAAANAIASSLASG